LQQSIPENQKEGFLIETDPMTTVHRLTWITAFALVTVISACASNLESRKKQAYGARSVGEVHFQQGNYTLALKSFLEAETLYADDPELQNDLGLAYMNKNRVDLAIRHFKKALALKPDFSKAKNNLGVAYLRKKDWDAAIACFKKLTEDLLYARPYFPLFNLGQAYYHKGNFTLAERYFQESLKQNAQFIDAFQGLGRTYMAMGKGAEAVKVIEKAVKLSPATQLLYFDLAQAHSLCGDDQKALRAYQKVIELNPGNALAAEAKKAMAGIKR